MYSKVVRAGERRGMWEVIWGKVAGEKSTDWSLRCQEGKEFAKKTHQ